MCLINETPMQSDTNDQHHSHYLESCSEMLRKACSLSRKDAEAAIKAAALEVLKKNEREIHSILFAKVEKKSLCYAKVTSVCFRIISDAVCHAEKYTDVSGTEKHDIAVNICRYVLSEASCEFDKQGTVKSILDIFDNIKDTCITTLLYSSHHLNAVKPILEHAEDIADTLCSKQGRKGAFKRLLHFLKCTETGEEAK